MKKHRGIAGAVSAPATRDVSDTERRASGTPKPQTLGRPGRPLMRERMASPGGAVGVLWPLDGLADIRHVKEN